MTPFFDRNLGTRLPTALRLVGQVLHYHDEVFPQTAVDTEIIARVAHEDWVLVTRDKKIRRRPAEVAAIRTSGAKCVVFAQRATMTTWPLMKRLVCSWEDIESIVDGALGPLIVSVYHDGRTKILHL